MSGLSTSYKDRVEAGNMKFPESIRFSISDPKTIITNFFIGKWRLTLARSILIEEANFLMYR